MSVYYKLQQADVLWACVTSNPRVVLASGSNGWHGSTGPSASLSLYEGVRSRPDVYAGSPSGVNVYPVQLVDTMSIDGVLYVSGSYPSTGSVRFVHAYDIDVSQQSPSPVTSDFWYREHFQPVVGLFDYYSRFNAEYFTGSYDFYSLFCWGTTPNSSSYVAFETNPLTQLTSSLTLGIQAKPLRVTGSDQVLQAQRGRWKFYITGSTGQLAWTDFATVCTSSVALVPGVWQDCQVVVGGGSASFYVGVASVGKAPYTGSLLAPNASAGYLTVGAELTSNDPHAASAHGFQGYLFESRIWSSVRTYQQLSASSGATMTGSALSDTTLVHYARFNDGPLGLVGDLPQSYGVTDYSPQEQPGELVNFNVGLSHSPTWQPCDDMPFVTPKVQINTQASEFRVVHVPSMFYGRQIATGSVKMVCDSYLNKGIQRVLVDDGRGRLYVSGSTLRPISGEDYAGMRWNKVGNVFYNEGLIVVTDPSMLDFGDPGLDPLAGATDTLQVAFSGLERTTTKVFQCRVGVGEANGSNNPTFSSYDPDPKSPFYDRYVVRQTPPTTWISAVGLYNEHHKLVAVAKLASPIRKREADKLLLRLKMDW